MQKLITRQQNRWNILLFWPILLILDITGVEPLEWPRSTELIVFLIINAMITFVSDMTMMLSMVSILVAYSKSSSSGLARLI